MIVDKLDSNIRKMRRAIIMQVFNENILNDWKLIYVVALQGLSVYSCKNILIVPGSASATCFYN